MLAIWKFDIPTQSDCVIYMPRGAQLLDVQVQRNRPVLWALVDPEAEQVPRGFALLGTGSGIATDGAPATAFREQYVGTFQNLDQTLVFHLFDRGEGR
jgi:hypothetical protein